MKQMVDTLPTSERSRIAIAFGEVCKTVLPSGWRCSEAFENAAVYLFRDGLKVICELESVDSELWLHVSLSRTTRIPSYDDVATVKRVFVGRERKVQAGRYH